jgi:putative phosphoribosyl transferase
MPQSETLVNAHHKELVHIEAGTVVLEGMLELPDQPIGIVAFSQDRGNNRLRARDTLVTTKLHAARIATLSLDLLTDSENHNQPTRFNIKLLTLRLNAVCHWIEKTKIISKLPLGLFSTNSGTAAALQVAATHSKGVAAIVSRSGRPDLINPNAFRNTGTPILLIVAGDDYNVIEVNRSVYLRLNCNKKLEIISGATHLFEEPGALEQVAELAVGWFAKYLPPASQDR